MSQQQNSREILVPVFYKDQETQKRYESRVHETITALETQYGDSYIPALHDEFVREFIRHQLLVERLEKDIVHGTTTSMSYKALEAERRQYNIMTDKLMASLQQVERTTTGGNGTADGSSIFDLEEDEDDE
jgi:hypothetical protein